MYIQHGKDTSLYRSSRILQYSQYTRHMTLPLYWQCITPGGSNAAEYHTLWDDRPPRDECGELSPVARLYSWSKLSVQAIVRLTERKWLDVTTASWFVIGTLGGHLHGSTWK